MFSPTRALLKVPVALLVSRACFSACAHVASIFDEYDFGPLIGEAAPATLTELAYPYPVRTRGGFELGQIELALSSELSGKTGQPLEGKVPTVDYPVPLTFDNRDTWDATLVDTALRAFKEYHFPKHTAPLGP